MNLQPENSTWCRAYKTPIEQAFKLCCKELDLEGSDVAIHFSVRSSDLMPPNCAGRTSDLKKDKNYIAVQLNCMSFMNKREFLRVFCHEMIHVQQEITGELIDDANERDTVWRGTKFPASAIALAQLPFMPENALPWEEDAYKRGPVLAKKIYDQVSYVPHTKIILVLLYKVAVVLALKLVKWLIKI